MCIQYTGKFVAALLGGNLGTVFTFQLTGIATELYGWRTVFYAEAALVLVITVLWVILVAKTPHSHPFISTKEIEYIEKSLGSTVSKEKVNCSGFMNSMIYLGLATEKYLL